MKFNVIISGVRFDYLLCSVYAADITSARKLAKREVLAGETYRVEAA